MRPIADGAKLFPNAAVCGADVDRRILFREDRIKTFYCDQSDRSSIRELWSQPDLQGGADIIIEDGLHTFEANVSFLEESLDHLCPGGIYVTEDITGDCVEDCTIGSKSSIQSDIRSMNSRLSS